MEILSRCRICQVRDVRMDLIINTYLQEIFEQLTSVPFQKEDGRPHFVCYICKARLKNCHELRVKCLRSEEYFRELLNNHIKPTPLQYLHTLQIHQLPPLNCVPVARKNIDGEFTIGDNDLKPDPLLISDVQVKEESIEATEDNESDSIVYTEPEDIFKTEDITIEVHDIVHTVEANVKIDSEADEQNLEDSLELDYNAQTTQLKDLCPRTVKVVLNKIHCDGIETSVPVPKKPKLSPVIEGQCTTASKPRLDVKFSLNKNVEKMQPVNKPSQEIDKNTGKYILAISTETVKTSSDLQANVKPYHCDICDKRFDRKGYLVIHTRIHTGEKPYRCDICDQRFDRKWNLERHTRIHTGEKPYRCDICDKRFDRKTNLVRHISIHTGEKLYRCDICDKRFNQRNSLVKHTRIHTGEKPYRCDICDERFNQRSSLVNHSRIHTGEKPYRCDICDEHFNQRSSLVNHTRIHTGEKPYRCDICDEHFNQRSSLVNHTRIHTGEKSYRCDICDKRFNQRCNLINHTRIHTGEKPYTCDICDKRFNQRNSLIRHARIHTGKKP